VRDVTPPREVENACLDGLETPCLLLDYDRMERNISRLRGRLASMGVRLRPHLKTAKAVEVARLMMERPHGPATVSTLREVKEFADCGVRDILYAVGIAPGKLARAAELRSGGVDLSLVVDSLEAARATAELSPDLTKPIPVLIEVDCDGRRSGIRPDQRELLVVVAREANQGSATLRGVMTHAGGSYDCRDAQAIVAVAEIERAAAVSAAATLREAELPCPIVSVGSTPTAQFAGDLTGVTEVRAGVFVFFDLVMAGIGVCVQSTT
jgi:D-serine deaminase-like pyridoxal phosphate-dependent protein